MSVATFLLSACNRPEDTIKPQPEKGFFSVRVKAVITVGDMVYDSIPATFTITSWDVNSVAQQKDTTLHAGAQVIYLPKNAVRYSLKMQKWGVTYEKTLNKAEVAEGALYQLSGQKEAKKLKWVTKERYVDGSFLLNTKEHIIYHAKGRINEIEYYGTNPNDGVYRSGSSDVFLYNGNEIRVNTVNKMDGAISSYNVYTLDAQGRTIQSKFQFVTESHVYTNHYTSEGILMLNGANATDPNGSRIALKFTGGNRVEEKTVIINYPTTVRKFAYDMNINPYAIIKMPSLYFEHSSKNNVTAEAWEGIDQSTINEYKYDAEGYVTEVITKNRNNNGQLVTYSRTIYTY